MASVVGYLCSLTSAEHSISHPIVVLWFWVTGQLERRWKVVSGTRIRCSGSVQPLPADRQHFAWLQRMYSTYRHQHIPLIPAEFTPGHATNTVTANLSLFNNITSHHTMIQNLLTPFCCLPSTQALMTSSTTCDLETWSLIPWLPTGELWRLLSVHSPTCITSIHVCYAFILMVSRRILR